MNSTKISINRLTKKCQNELITNYLTNLYNNGEFEHNENPDTGKPLSLNEILNISEYRENAFEDYPILQIIT